jgi:hypothetical protein
MFAHCVQDQGRKTSEYREVKESKNFAQGLLL